MSDVCPAGPASDQPMPCGLSPDDALERTFQSVAGKYPPGWAWDAVADRDTRMGQQTLAIAEIARDVEDRACALLAEWLCYSATETMPEWMTDYGLPDACGLNDLCAKLAAIGGASRAYFYEIASWFGYTDIVITEHTPLQCGLTPVGGGARLARDGRSLIAGGSCGSPLIRYVWTVTVGGPRLQRFSTGYGAKGGQRTGVGQPLLAIRRADDLECLFNRLKPAHTRLVFAYTGA